MKKILIVLSLAGYAYRTNSADMQTASLYIDELKATQHTAKLTASHCTTICKQKYWTKAQKYILDSSAFIEGACYCIIPQSLNPNSPSSYNCPKDCDSYYVVTFTDKKNYSCICSSNPSTKTTGDA